MYLILRNIHLFCGVLALPALLMYAVSAIQMAHSKWFVLKPAITETTVSLQPGLTDGRRIAFDVMGVQHLRGQITAIQNQPRVITVRIVVPGTVHELTYTSSTGAVRVRTSVAGVMGMLNRLHHAGGLWPSYLPLRLWGVFVAIASIATIGLGASGVWMWWLRRQERKWGLILLTANLTFSIGILLTIRLTH
jgi:hypothetical protein